MSPGGPDDPRAAALRREFDAAFAAPSAGLAAATDDLLLVRIAGDRFAIRAADVTAVAAIDAIVPVPSRAPDLLGLVARRGSVVPVFALAPLLGYPAAAEPPRWMVVCDPLWPIGLAFAGFERLVRIARTEVHGDAGDQGRDHLGELARVNDEVRAIVAVGSVVEAIRARAGRRRPTQGA